MTTYYTDAEGNQIDAEQACATLAAHRTELANRRAERLELAGRMQAGLLAAVPESFNHFEIEEAATQYARIALAHADALLDAVDREETE